MAHQNEPKVSRVISFRIDFVESFYIKSMLSLKILLIMTSFLMKYLYFEHISLGITLLVSFIVDIFSTYLCYVDAKELKEMYMPYRGRSFYKNLQDAAIFVGYSKIKISIFVLLLLNITYFIVKLV